MREGDIPAVGLSGHAITTKVRTTITPEERGKMMSLRGCPVNRKIKTKMTRDAFKRACLIHQENAGIGNSSEEELEGGNKGIITLDGFKTNNWYMCAMCNTGEQIREGNNTFKPPINLTFIKGPVPTTKRKKRKKHSKHTKNRRRRTGRDGSAIIPRKKVTDDQVMEIKKMLANGVSVTQIHADIGGVICKTSIYNIRKGSCWAHVKLEKS